MKTPNFKYLSLDEIDISLSNVRKAKIEENIHELASSIEEIGVQQPVVVSQKNGRYELIIGQRRYIASKMVGGKDIPALITKIKDETDAIIISFSENIHRHELEYRDKMDASIKLLDKFKSINKVAGHLGVTPQTVKNWLGYSAVPESIKKLVDEKKLSATTATRIAKNIPDEKLALRIARKVKETPRSEAKIAIIDIARENLGKSPAEIFKIARQQSAMQKITIHVTKKVFNALINATNQYRTDKEDVVKEALEEWLNKRGFV